MQLPKIIQGGMGVAISDWKLAKTVSNLGSLGVVSGTGIANILIARLMSGDAGGHIRRAMTNFPIQEPILNIINKYYRPSDDSKKITFKRPQMWQFKPSKALTELTVVANFVEVFLAREGHDRPVGLNLLEKIQFPTVASLYGAMLAGVTVIVMGAGIPDQIPVILDDLSQHKSTEHRIFVHGGSVADNFHISFEPEQLFPGITKLTGPLQRPYFLPIVSSDILAKALIKKTNGNLDGFIIEAPWAGGHNAPPRGQVQLNDRGEPMYGDRDTINLTKFKDLGFPFWLAGGYDNPEKLKFAMDSGASGIQVGTAFAFCDESGLIPQLKQQVIDQVLAGQIDIRTDPRISPTGFPFKVVQLSNTVSDKNILNERDRLCDHGLLRQVKKDADGKMIFFCPAEPAKQYLSKGGEESDLLGRSCLCNNLIASAGFPQTRLDGYTEAPLVTAGDGITGIGKFIPSGKTHYTAKDVLNYIELV
ncbi:MAG: nitronate monooxygenase [Candidatus Marinimicrobia bacterium]|nr:nitronate monooxygenase [Candidatus Neomarinimicrobiota bacterium]